MTEDHRRCDQIFTEVERVIAAEEWERTTANFNSFSESMDPHFAAEEGTLFPAFEAKSAMTMGPTQVMRDEHVQMREWMSAARSAGGKRRRRVLGKHGNPAHQACKHLRRRIGGNSERSPHGRGRYFQDTDRMRVRAMKAPNWYLATTNNIFEK